MSIKKSLALILVVILFGAPSMAIIQAAALKKDHIHLHIESISHPKEPEGFGHNELISHVSETTSLIEPDLTTGLTLSSLSHPFPSIYMKILLYHYIRDYTNEKDIVGMNLSVSQANFDKQMKSIKDAGYHTILYKDIIQNIAFGTPLPTKPIMLNFDDGYDGMYTAAFPILKKYEMHASFGIITNRVGTIGYLNWDQIKEIKLMGNEMVSHTVSHPSLAISSIPKQVFELRDSKETLDRELNQDTQVIIYPSGKYTPETIALAKQEGYLIGRTTNYFNQINSTNLYELGINRVNNASEIK